MTTTISQPTAGVATIPVASSPTMPQQPQAPAPASGAPTTTDDGPAITLTLPDGRQITIPLKQAVALGIVNIDAQGKPFVTDAGKATLAKLSAADPSHTPNGSAPAPTGVAAAKPTAATAPQEATPEPPSPRKVIGTATSAAFLASGLLRIAKGPGMPNWIQLYFATMGLDKFTGHKFAPEWLKSGPIDTLIGVAIPGKYLISGFKGMPEEIAHYHSTMDAVRKAAKDAGRQVTAIDHLKALLKPDEVVAAEQAAAAAAKAAQAAAKSGASAAKSAGSAAAEATHEGAAIAAQAAKEPFFAKLFPFIDPISKIANTLFSVGSLMDAQEYFGKHGLSGTIRTTSGRSAVMNAIQGVCNLATTFLPASPMSAILDLTATVAWMFQTFSDNKWLDGFLGGDPPEPKAAAAPAAA